MGRATVRIALRALLVLTTLLPLACASTTARPRNVILLIGDGMGPEQVKAASQYAHGADGRLSFQSLPHQGTVSTHSAGGPRAVTDSAAAATAMATGRKVDNGVLSVATPGDGSPLRTALEYAQAEGRRTGLVTTTTLTNATPAGFACHVASRSESRQIAEQILGVRPNVLLGGGGAGMTDLAAQEAGYAIVKDRESLRAAVAAKEDYVCGLFGQGYMPYEYEYASGTHRAYNRLPHLSEMTSAALELLAAGENGFFLMVEGGRIDHAGHSNDLQNIIVETVEFDSTVKAVLEWARGRDDTLILVTADHETGGLHVMDDPGQGRWPNVEWSSKNHTGVRVPIYAWGVGAQAVEGDIDNTDIFTILTGRPKPVPAPATPAARPTTEPAMSGSY